MKHIIRKLFWLWESDKEEKWLNEMSAKGLQLCEVGLRRYVFEESIPGEYVYRLELLENMPKHAESIQYIQFIVGTGAEMVGSMTRWVYFRKKADKGGFNLFSDIESRIKQLDKVLLYTGMLLATNLLNGINQLIGWLSRGRLFSLTFGVICLALVILIGYGYICILSQRRKLTKEKILHE